MDDLISKDKVIDLIMETDPEWAVGTTRAIFEGVKRMPPVDRKKGRWISADAIFGGVPFYCSECGENTLDTVMGKPRWNFCPNCGAEMRGEENE